MYTQKRIAEYYANLVCIFSNNNFPIFLFKRGNFVINAVLLLSSIFNICLIFIVSNFLLLYMISFLNFHITYLATKIKKLTNSTSFMLCLSYKYIPNIISS